MKTAFEKCHLIEGEAPDGDSLPRSNQQNNKWFRFEYVAALCGILLLSSCLNVYYGIKLYRVERENNNAQSAFDELAGLRYDTIVPDDHWGLYNSKNKSLTDAAWDALNYDTGSVALSYEYAASKDLPLAQPFPWDESKGIYFIAGYHGLHCLKTMRRTMLELLKGVSEDKLGYSIEHCLHCFNSLRQDIICTADDTPRETSFKHPGTIGVGQPHICRNWAKLEAWAKEHTACWRDLNPTVRVDTLRRYRYCPEGSPYNKRIHETFGDFETGKNASALPDAGE